MSLKLVKCAILLKAISEIFLILVQLLCCTVTSYLYCLVLIHWFMRCRCPQKEIWSHSYTIHSYPISWGWHFSYCIHLFLCHFISFMWQMTSGVNLFCPYIRLPTRLINKVILNWMSFVSMKESSVHWRRGHPSLLKSVWGGASWSLTVPAAPISPIFTHAASYLHSSIPAQLGTVLSICSFISLSAPFNPGSFPRFPHGACWHWRLAHWIVWRPAEIIYHPV